MDYLMHSAFLGVAFFLGVLITSFLKSKKIDALTHEAQEVQSKFYELQNLMKKQLGEKEDIIKKLRKENTSNVDRLSLLSESPSNDSKRIQSLEDKNSSLKRELLSLKARAKELKVENAVKRVEKNYPMQLYGMCGENSSETSKIDKNFNNKNRKLSSKGTKKLASKIISRDDAMSPKTKKAKSSKIKIDLKPKKAKKKSKSKKGKSKKVLALIESEKKSKKKKSSEKKKKK